MTRPGLEPSCFGGGVVRVVGAPIIFFGRGVGGCLAVLGCWGGFCEKYLG